MDRTPDIRQELKALGTELAEAFKQIRSSHELKELEHEIAVGIRKLTATLAHSLKAAAKADQTAKIGRRLKRVAKAGASEGAAGAAAARRAIVQRFKRIKAAAAARKHRAHATAE